MKNAIKAMIINTLKKGSLFIILIIGLFVTSAIDTYAANISKQDMNAIKQYIRKTYGTGYKIRVTEPAKMTEKQLERYEKTMETRQGKKTVFVERFETKAISKKAGLCTTKGILYKSYIGYACKVNRGQKVISYLVYNPNSNHTDDIVAIVTKGKIK